MGQVRDAHPGGQDHGLRRLWAHWADDGTDGQSSFWDESAGTAASRGQLAQEEAMAVAQWEFGEKLHKIDSIVELAGPPIVDLSVRFYA